METDSRADALADILPDLVEAALAECVNSIGSAAANKAPAYTGSLRRSLLQTGTDRVSDIQIDGWIGVVPYWWETEEGTGPVDVPVGDGTPGSGLWHWVKKKKLAAVKLKAGPDKGLVLRRGAGVDAKSGVEGKLGSVGIYQRGNLQTPARHSRKKQYLTALEQAEASLAWAVHRALLKNGLRAQHWFRESRPDLFIAEFEAKVARFIGGEVHP